MDSEILQVIASQNSAITSLLESNKNLFLMRYGYLALTGLLSTALGAYLALKINNASHKKRVRGESVKAFIELIYKFENQCLEYWSRDYDHSCSLIEEAKIKAGHKLIRQYVDHGKFGLEAAIQNQLKKKVSELFDAATGGDFESSRRKKSRKQMQKIAMLSAGITPVLIEKSFE